MHQTDHTAIVLRNAPYKDNDRMLTLLSPTKGRVEALARGCRRPKSPLLNASELFALGDFDFYERGGRMTVTSATLIETFYPLRADFDRLAVGTYLLNLCELSAQPGQNCQELFMLLLHTLSRLTFSGSLFLTLLYFLPNLLTVFGSMPYIVTQFFGGTSLLIMVGVVLDTLQQVEGHLKMHYYDGLMREGSIKGRTTGQAY